MGTPACPRGRRPLNKEPLLRIARKRYTLDREDDHTQSARARMPQATERAEEVPIIKASYKFSLERVDATAVASKVSLYSGTLRRAPVPF